MRSPSLWNKKEATELRSTQIWENLKRGIASRKLEWKERIKPLKQKLKSSPQLYNTNGSLTSSILSNQVEILETENRRVDKKVIEESNQMIEESNKSNQMIEESNQVIEDLNKPNKVVEDLSLKRWKWASEVMETREMSSKSEEEKYSPYMDPLVEFYSFSQISNVEIFVKKGKLKMLAKEEIKEGERIVVNSGERDNVYLLENYGFMLPSLKITLDLSLSLNIHDSLFGNKMLELHKFLKFKFCVFCFSFSNCSLFGYSKKKRFIDELCVQIGWREDSRRVDVHFENLSCRNGRFARF